MSDSDTSKLKSEFRSWTPGSGLDHGARTDSRASHLGSEAHRSDSGVRDENVSEAGLSGQYYLFSVGKNVVFYPGI